MTTPTAAILSVGDELITGRILDRHAAYAASRLQPLGIEPRVHLSLGDAPGELSEWLSRLAPEVDLILVTGGLGPTEDDRTRAEVAKAAGVALQFSEDAWGGIRARYGDRLRSPERNRRQAYFPVGALEIPNPYGTAPAFAMLGSQDGVPSRLGWWVLPGVPREFQALFDEVVLDRLSTLETPDRSEEVVRVFGISESVLDGWLIGWIPRKLRTEYHLCVSDGEIEIRAPETLDLGAAVRREFGERFLGSGPEDLAHRLVSVACRSGASIATAESCTGGLLAGRITDVPGASACFERGWVTYSNASKVAELGVSSDLLESHGAVSAEAVEAMVRWALDRATTTHAAALSGIAGPGGGEGGKSLGTVFLAIASRERIDIQELHLAGGRERVRTLAVQNALFGLLKAIRAEV